MGSIVVLDENMINMIAAGEVVERPASVVKELLENSIDAGARTIVVKIEDGGKRLIQVIDDGSGMDGADLEKAFLPHATSKVKSSQDLSHIATMGFRGEALASIASIAHVTATTRQAGSNEGARLEIDCGKRVNFGPASASTGTSIEVRDIFYRVPARQKFLRSANTEMGHITEQFTRIGLCNPQLDLTLIHNGKEIYRLLAGQGLRERIGILISKQIASELMEVTSSERSMEVFAFMGLPGSARSSADYQYTFLNGRFIRDKFISHAIKEAYRGLMEPGKSPIVFLFLKMPHEAYDVNVHPTKIEVRFDNSNLVHSQVLAVLRQKLLGTNLDVVAQLPKAASEIAGEAGRGDKAYREQVTEAMQAFFKDNKPQYNQQRFSYDAPRAVSRTSEPGEPSGRSGPVESQEQFESKYSLRNDYVPQRQVPIESESPKGYLQLHDSYIVAQIDSGFVIVDQHALHERIIYEDLCRKVSQGPLESQRLLIPEAIEVTDAQTQAIEQNSTIIEKLGIKIEPFGPKTIAIQAFPTLLGKVSPGEFLRGLLDLMTDKRYKLDAERLLHEVLDMAACKAAIKAGQKLTQMEIEALLENKETVERASRCPHGRPTTITFSLTELQKQFKRTGF